VLTRGDDYPIHQRPEPVAYAGTDRNFYDRYFFNGYHTGEARFFAVALGVYPHLNVMDAAFVVIDGGVQHNLRASRLLNMERLQTSVGPISVDVVEPLQVLRIRVDDAAHAIRAELTFRGRTLPIEEPRFTRRSGPRTTMDYTRMTQNGTWDGWIELHGTRTDVRPDLWRGTRDRSWGIRPVGKGDPQAPAPPAPAQFYWLWSPLNFDDAVTLYHVNADAEGVPWNTSGLICGIDGDAPRIMASVSSDVRFKRGTRHASSAEILFVNDDGAETQIELTPQYHFYMSGAGYMHPEWGHGMYRGELDVGYDCFSLDAVDEQDRLHLHVQAFVTATMYGAEGERTGCGVLEQLIIGAHRPSGLTGLLDPAP
jgi:hypothetical protein